MNIIGVKIKIKRNLNYYIDSKKNIIQYYTHTLISTNKTLYK